VRRAALLAVGLVALALAPGGLASEERPTQNELESEIMCPICATTLDQSDARMAQNMKQFIAGRIAAGDTKSEIEDQLVSRFGEQVLAAPPREGFNLLAWLLPLVGLLAAVPIVGWAAWRWSRGRAEPPAGGAPKLEPELERRLERELARFES
jgi:cytochrome c-type biogenesis protein CcmH